MRKKIAQYWSVPWARFATIVLLFLFVIVSDRIGETLAQPYFVINAIGGLQIGSGTTILQHFSGTGTVNPGAIAATSSATATVTVTGASTTNTASVVCSPGVEIVAAGGGFTLEAFVSSANTVTIRLGNPSAGSQTQNSPTWRCDVWQH